MRCYLMKDGQIHGVEFLVNGPDESLIEQANALLERHAARGIEGVEIWSGKRFVHRATREAPKQGARP
jgi:hypothetical protein